MAFVDEIGRGIVEAMKAHDTVRLATLRMLKTALVNKSIEKAHDLDEAEAQQVVRTLIKQRRESIEQFLKGGRKDLADREAAELALLEAFLPPAVDPAALEQVVVEAIAEAGATSPKDMGKVMKTVMARLAGQPVDGKAVNDLVRRKLTPAG